MEHVVCATHGCTTEFYTYKGQHQHCTVCKSGDLTPIRNESTSSYYTRHGESFDRRREWVLAIFNYRCAECGLSNAEHKRRDDLWPPGGGLHIHHIKDAAEFEQLTDAHSPDNLVPLCDACHKQETWG